MDTTTQIPYLRKDSIIQVSLGTEMVNRLQQVLAHVIEGHSQVDMDAIGEHVKAGTLQPWESSAITLSQLLQSVLEIANATNCIDYRDITEVLTG